MQQKVFQAIGQFKGIRGFAEHGNFGFEFRLSRWRLAKSFIKQVCSCTLLIVHVCTFALSCLKIFMVKKCIKNHQNNRESEGASFKR